MTVSNQPASHTTTAAWPPHDSDHNPVLDPLPGHPHHKPADAHPLPPQRPITAGAAQFFHHIGWMRTAKPGVLQLNPWLTVAGTSAE
jgi:hypothetical protein